MFSLFDQPVSFSTSILNLSCPSCVRKVDSEPSANVAICDAGGNSCAGQVDNELIQHAEGVALISVHIQREPV